MLQKDAKIIGVWGGRGSGKSTCAKGLTRKNNRVIVIDPVADWESAGFAVYKTKRGLYTALRNGWGRGFRVCYQLDQNADPVGQLSDLADDLFKIQAPYKAGKDTRKITLVVDEMSLCLPNRTLKNDERGMLRLCNLGRHWGIEIIGISQRMAQVHMDFRGNTAEDYFFRLRSATDQDVALQLMGRSVATQLRNLQTHEFLHFCQGKISRGKNRL